MLTGDFNSNPDYIKGPDGKMQGSKPGQASAEGRNKPCTGFRNEAAVRAHKKHWKEFGFTSQEEYDQSAIDFIKQPVGGNIDGYLREEDGAVIRFDVSTGVIGVGIPGAEVLTYFIPGYNKKTGCVNLNRANNYFNRLKKVEQYE